MESLLRGVRRQEYTGSRRCWPCTIVNLAILGVFVAVVGLWVPVVAVVVAVAGVAILWLRGYLVPYTPVFAPRLADALPWNPFHGTERSDSLATTTDTSAEAVMQSLVDAGVIRPVGEGIELEESFEAAWYDEMDDLVALDDDELAREALEESTAADASVTRQGGRTYVVLTDGSGSPAGEAWLRRPVAVVETAAARTLRDWAVEPSLRPSGAHALGLFLTTCPECGGPVTEQPASGCCGPPETGPTGELLQARVCESCEVRYHVFE